MKNEKLSYEEIENLLKSKMSDLSDSVDCFDKISARVFPEEKQDFSESGFTVSDLENITGRYQKRNLIKWGAVAAAAVVCIAVLPKVDFVRQVFSNIVSGSVKKNYQQLIGEINSELKSGDYLIFDVPFDFYSENDVIVTPLFACPFEDCGKDDAVVRFFIKQINGINTTQMYAALYCDTYSENNIIAAAESNYKFTADDMDFNYVDFQDQQDIAIQTVGSYFSCDDSGYIIGSDGKTVSLASFISPCITKIENNTIGITSNVIFGKDSDSQYFYDMISTSGNTDVQLPDRNKMWKKSIYFNGNSALPEENSSFFKRELIFNSPDIGTTSNSNFSYVMPSYVYGWSPEPYETFTLYKETSSTLTLSELPVPLDPYNALSMKIYFSADIDEELGFTNADQIFKLINNRPSNSEYTNIVFQFSLDDSENYISTNSLSEEELKMRSDQEYEIIKEREKEMTEEMETKRLEEEQANREKIESDLSKEN